MPVLAPFTDLKVLRVVDDRAPGYRGFLVMALEGRIGVAQVPLARGVPATERTAQTFDTVVAHLLERLRGLSEAQRVRWFDFVDETADPYLLMDTVSSGSPSE